ncbi:hypothetical protein KSP39_PZI016024 [Platanthera zijinensis]|uniref:Uncharacterized protein n=1 Tax=Platanthera zijinensis TaxID=2320716 RepID=A0AAP0B922_9ASPA
MVKLSAKTWRWLWRGLSKKESARPAIGILTFEVSRLMSKIINLWHALSDDRIAVLRDETLRLQGIRKLVSDDDDFLLGLALDETMESVHLLARAVARLGARCTDPLLRRFESVFSNLAKNNSDLGLVFTRKKMNREIKRMERFIIASSNLYQELDVLADVENDLRRMHAIPETHLRGCRIGPFKKRVLWQRQNVKQLQGVSVWNCTYDYVALLLARALFTIVARIRFVFGFQHNNFSSDAKTMWNLSERSFMSGGLIKPFANLSNARSNGMFASGPLMNSSSPGMSHVWPGRRHAVNNHGYQDCNSSSSPESTAYILNKNASPSLFDFKPKLLNAPPSTLGGSALALHYAKVIITIEKLSSSPNSIDPEVRDDLYNMLPKTTKLALKMRLSSYAKNLTLSVYDQALAEEWSDAMARILEWLSPLAHSMVKWQSDRNFEKQSAISRANVLLLQTLYYANQAKVEAAITELLVGLNYLWRFGRELSEKAMLDSVGGKGFDDGCKRVGMARQLEAM